MPSAAPVQPAGSGFAETRWEPGPTRPRLHEGAVHVWRADLSQASDELFDLLSIAFLARCFRCFAADKTLKAELRLLPGAM